ncbi:MAG: type II toxin-antitoxin system VapC family toxin [Actinobacteria bacterium]|nr:type II toxin-antitoxin system VapC family toxin [Actinomycetota bacterium]MBW3641505.1 type II toxin-antitoxin system VapC family toxin [Actinomycetota bacterium]
MADLLVDTDVFVDHVRGTRALRPGQNRLCYSIITRCELYAGTRADEEVLRLLLGSFPELPVDRAVAERAGRLRRAAGIHTADALIAATALHHNLTLLSGRHHRFDGLPGLRLRLPSVSPS